MIPLTYTLSIEQESTLRHIEMLRAQLLSFVVPLYIERARRWALRIDTVSAAYTLIQEPTTVAHIEQAIQARKPSHHQFSYKRYWKTLEQITEDWTGSNLYRNSQSYIELFQSLELLKQSKNTTGTPVQEAIVTGVGYISSGNEHPVIQAAIMSALLFTCDMDTRDAYFCALLSAEGIFVTHGYTCHDRVSPLTQWAKEAVSLKKAIESINRTQNLNHWILFVTLSIKKSLEDAIQSLQDTQLTDIASSTIDRYMRLSRRQKDILQLLQKPGSTVNNSFLQRQFGISQMTASRELSHLTSLGLLSPYGKSRSISYTRIG